MHTVPQLEMKAHVQANFGEWILRRRKREREEERECSTHCDTQSYGSSQDETVKHKIAEEMLKRGKDVHRDH